MPVPDDYSGTMGDEGAAVDEVQVSPPASVTESADIAMDMEGASLPVVIEDSHVERRLARARPRSRTGVRSADDPLAGLDGPAPVAGDGDVAEPEPEPKGPPTVDEVLANLGLGNLAFNPPAYMQMQEKKIVHLILSSTDSAAALKAELPEEDQGTAKTATGVRVAPRMEATLTGAGFQVEALTPVEQAVSRVTQTKWSWAVIPTEPGKQYLHLALSARIEVEGKDVPFVVRTFERQIEVKVTIEQEVSAFIGAHWQWLWSTLLVPMAVWWWGQRGRKKRQT